MSYPKKFNNDAIILDLSKIEKLLNTSSLTEKETFLRNFRKWLAQRKLTLDELEKLKNELDSICFKAKVGKCVGTGVGVIGSLAAILGFGLSLSSNESVRSVGKELSKVGAGAGVVGGATSVTSSIVEYQVNKRILNEVKLTLEKDQHLTRELIPFLKTSQELNSLFKQVFDCDMLSDTVKDILTVVQGITSLYQQGRYTYEEISRAFSCSMEECPASLDLLGLKRIFRGLSKKVQFVLQEFCDNPKVREAVLKICSSLNASPIIFDIARIALQVLSRVFGNTEKPGFSSLLWRLVSETAKNAHILMRSVIVAMEIVTLVSTAKDIANSESKYSEVVAEVELSLLREMNEAKLLVNRITRNQI